MKLLLGTRTSAEINLIAQLLMVAALWIGFYFARTKQIHNHSNVQTTVVLVNIFSIAGVMITTFYSAVIVGGPRVDATTILIMMHGSLGLIAELSGIYLVLRMCTQLIPPRFRVRNFKLVMRALLGMWTLIVILGLRASNRMKSLLAADSYNRNRSLSWRDSYGQAAAGRQVMESD